MKYILLLSILTAAACNSQSTLQKVENNTESTTEIPRVAEVKAPTSFALADGITLGPVVKTEDEWKATLNEMEYYVLREKGTERAFIGEYHDSKKEGIYVCRACSLPLFDSKSKFDSGTGWPSYFEPIAGGRIQEDTDYNLGYARTEILCARCGGHLGHVFDDGPKPTGLRYCVNSVSVEFFPVENIDVLNQKLLNQVKE